MVTDFNICAICISVLQDAFIDVRDIIILEVEEWEVKIPKNKVIILSVCISFKVSHETTCVLQGLNEK